MKSENQIEKFKLIADKLTSKISSFDGVVGVVFMGGLARGFADKYSDIDIDVYLNKENEKLRARIRKLGLDTQASSGVDVDISVHTLEELEKRRWTEIDRWDFSHSKIAYDSDRLVEKLFKRKLKTPKDFWLRRISICSEHLKWYCCPPKEGVGTMAEAWIERGHLTSAHYCLTYAVDLMLRIVFTLNREFVPPQKWTIHYSYGLAWLPEGYRNLLEEAMTIKRMSVGDFDRRLDALRTMWREIVPKIEDETGLTIEKLSKYYVENVLRQNP